jgi:hypothetical protein
VRHLHGLVSHRIEVRMLDLELHQQLMGSVMI